VVALQPYFESGAILPPHWLPPWMQHDMAWPASWRFRYSSMAST
jgi:hypothetical protein